MILAASWSLLAAVTAVIGAEVLNPLETTVATRIIESIILFLSFPIGLFIYLITFLMPTELMEIEASFYVVWLVLFWLSIPTNGALWGVVATFIYERAFLTQEPTNDTHPCETTDNHFYSASH